MKIESHNTIHVELQHETGDCYYEAFLPGPAVHPLVSDTVRDV